MFSRIASIAFALFLALWVCQPAHAATFKGLIEQDMMKLGRALACEETSLKDEAFLQNFLLQYSNYIAKKYTLPLNDVINAAAESIGMMAMGAIQFKQQGGDCGPAQKEFMSLMREVGISDQKISEARENARKAQEEAMRQEEQKATARLQEEVRRQAEAKRQEEVRRQEQEETARQEARRQEEVAKRQEEARRQEEAKLQELAARTWTNSLGMKFILIPAGTFTITKKTKNEFGEEATQTQNMDIAPFYMGIYPVTQEQWVAVMGSNPGDPKGRNNPVNHVIKETEVQEFIKRLNAKEGHNRYRLPTAMEREHAARGGTSTPYFFGATPERLGDYAWFDRNSGGTTHPVGEKKPNQYGLYDVYGNVYEFVQDKKGGDNVICGCFYNDSASRCQSNYRDTYYANNRDGKIGFRLALTPEQGAKSPGAAPQSAITPAQTPSASPAATPQSGIAPQSPPAASVAAPQPPIAPTQSPPNTDLAALQKAAEQGNAGAQNNLGTRYSKGEGVPKDEAKAAQWYQKAAEQGLAVAQNNLGFMYANGRGVPKDYAKAAQWYNKAASQGDSDAQVRLGLMYVRGQGMQQDATMAKQWFQRAADKGNETAQYNLGYMYDEGIGVNKDVAQAEHWYRKAAAQGDTKAQDALKTLSSNQAKSAR